MSRILPENRLDRVVIATVGYVQAFYNALDTQVIKDAGPGGSLSDLLGAFDTNIAQDKWTILDDWMGTSSATWRPPSTRTIRPLAAFVKSWPVPEIWSVTKLRAKSDPYGLFLPQEPDHRVTLPLLNGGKCRRRIGE